MEKNKFLNLLGLSDFLKQLKNLFVTKNELVNIQPDWSVTDTNSNAYIKNKPTSMPASDVSSWAKESKKPTYTASEIGADPSGSASSALSSAKVYTDEKVSELINGAPETLDTLKEIADAIEENDTIVEALDNAIGSKANANDLTSHINNSTMHITASERTKWDSAKTHADSVHAPSNAERNAIVSIKKNGQALNPDSTRSVNIEVPDDYIISGEQTSTSSVDGGLNTFTFRTSKGESSTFNIKNGSKGSKGERGLTGAKGATGTRGSKWYNGTAITGTSTTATVFSGSGISNALIDDYYLNTSTSYVYKCTVSGSASAAKWVYIGSIRGIAGINATTTSVATSSKNGLMSSADFIKLSNMTNEILLESEPTNQQNGDYWIKEY